MEEHTQLVALTRLLLVGALAACAACGSNSDSEASPEILSGLILYEEFQQGLFVVTAAGTAKRRVVRELGVPDGGISDAAWSPDGKRLAYFQWNLGLFVARWDGARPIRIVPGSMYAWGANRLTWSPDGRRIAFSGDQGLYVTVLATKRTRHVLRGPISDRVDWSPNGRRIAFAVHAGPLRGLWTISPDGRSRRRLVAGEGIELSRSAWAPDSRQLVYKQEFITDDYQVMDEIYAVAANGTRRRALTDATESIHTPPLWSPRGARIVYSVQLNCGGPDEQGEYCVRESLIVRSVERPQDRTALDAGSGSSGPVWSPEGSWLAFTNDSLGLVIAQPVSAQARVVSGALPEALGWRSGP